MHSRRRSARSHLLALGLPLAGCAGPGLVVDLPEPDAAVFVDGRFVGRGGVQLPFRFYGASSLTVVPVRRTEREDVRAAVRTVERADPPAPQWLFPFDFFVEAVRRGFAPAPPAAVSIDLPPPAPTLVSGTRPAHANELRARAAVAKTER